MRSMSRIVFTVMCVALFTATMACGGPDDATLAAEVRSKLAAEPGVPASAVTVAAKDGGVTLTGMVGSESEKARAEQVAKSVKGVKSVANSLIVRPPVVNAPPPPVSPDVKLKTDVTAALAKYGVSGVTVDVANGEVTLTGTIARAKLQDALKAANESSPRKVNNKLTIK
jgi:osmotically-inducible protein OsmY